MPTEARTFPVDHIGLTRSLTRTLSITLVASFIGIVLVRFILSGFDLGHTFKHVSMIQFLIGLALVFPFSWFLAFTVSLFMKRAFVVLDDDHLSALNYWCIRRSVPLHDLRELGEFESNGLKSVTVISACHGTLYISDKTVGRDDLLRLLEDQIDRNSRGT